MYIISYISYIYYCYNRYKYNFVYPEEVANIVLQNFVIYLQEGKPMFSSGIDFLQILKLEGIFPGRRNEPVFGEWRGNSPPSPSRENLATFFPSSFIDLVFLNEFHSIQGYSVTT